MRPLLKASYTLNWTLGHGEFGFHLFNNAVHALNAALLYLIGRDLFKNHFAALIAAFAFAMHPIATEAVTYISGRSSSLMAVFYLGALYAYVRGREVATAVLLFLAFMARPDNIVFLAIFAVLLVAFRQKAWGALAGAFAAVEAIKALAGLGEPATLAVNLRVSSEEA